MSWPSNLIQISIKNNKISKQNPFGSQTVIIQNEK